MENTNFWTPEDNKRIKLKMDRTAQIIDESYENEEESVVLKVDFKTGNFERFDSSNMDSFVPQKKKKVSRKKGKKAA